VKYIPFPGFQPEALTAVDSRPRGLLRVWTVIQREFACGIMLFGGERTNAMIGATADAYIAGNLIGFTVGLVISILLLVLTLRAAGFPGTPVANIALAVCSLVWSMGGLANVILHPQVSTAPHEAGSIALAIQFTAAGVWPIPMLAIWRYLAIERWQCVCWRYLQVIALGDAAVILAGLWAGVAGTPFIPVRTLHELSAYNATFLALSAATMFLRSRMVSRSVRFSALIVLAGLGITTLAVFIEANFPLEGSLQCALGIISQQSVLLVIIGGFFLFARFRFADLFIRYSLRLLLASMAAAVLILLVDAPFIRDVAARSEYPRAIRFFVTTILATALLADFALVERSLVKRVNRWIFRAPDYWNAVRELAETLRPLYSESEVTAAVGKAVEHTLGVDSVRTVALSTLPPAVWPPEIHEGQIAELHQSNPVKTWLSQEDLELLVPVRGEGRVLSVLAISLGQARRSLVSQELNYLRSVAEQLGSRLDLLRLEHEMVERESREALLLQQVTEAELRALCAQINPHFLFNSLNTIANLIVTNPVRAETMTLRLAKVFRHVLAHSSRPLAPIREEIEFLRTYLEIEEARFGSRLQVQIDVSPEAALDSVPSLILQPVVENALKHGLAPKIGPGRLWISAKVQGDQICLAVEDDGVGPPGAKAGKINGNGFPSHGVGLKNITQRLATLYQDRAQVTLEPRDPEGTRVILLVPRGIASAPHGFVAGGNGDAKPDC
jgi:two-component system, LytTR family, sensor kinase